MHKQKPDFVSVLKLSNLNKTKIKINENQLREIIFFYFRHSIYVIHNSKLQSNSLHVFPVHPVVHVQ